MAKAPQQVETPTATPTRKTRESKCKKVYLVNGEESSHASPDASELQFRFANGETETVSLQDFPTNIRDACAWHGISQKLGDTYAQADDADDARDKFLNVAELLMKGEWIKVGERVGGAPSTQLNEAFSAHLLDKGKKDPTTDEGKAKIAAYIKGLDKAARKALSELPEVAVHLAAIKRRVAEAREAKLQAAVKSAPASDTGADQFV